MENLGAGFLHEPSLESGFVSQFVDAAFNQNIFLWDTCFMTMFCNYAHPYVPGICSLDNFYAKQHEDGEISREINRATGKDFHQWANSEGEQQVGIQLAKGPQERKHSLQRKKPAAAKPQADPRRAESSHPCLG